MHTRVSPDDVPLLWTQSPRFVEIMRNGSGFQHPHYFFSQTDKLTALLSRLAEDTSAFGPCDGYLQAYEVLTKLLNESQLFSSLTREGLRHLEPNVRSFVDEVQNVDWFVADLDERRRAMSMKTSSKKRGRSDDEEEEMMYSFKRRRETCGTEMMEIGAGFNGALPNVSPWMQTPATQPVLWNEPFYNYL